MRAITKIIVHCSATKPSMDIGFAEVNSWHKANGWMSPSGISCGYHKIIRRSGKIENGRPLHEIGAHVQSHNTHSIGICMVGGMDVNGKDDCNFTFAQYAALKRLCVELLESYPAATLHGHREFSTKACPTFDIVSLVG